MNYEKILLIRFARLGDVILLVPSIRMLRRHFPHAQIDVVAGRRCAPVLGMCSAVNNVISVNRLEMRDGSKLAAIRNIFRLSERIRKERYDLVLDFHSFRETNLLAWYSRAKWRLGLRRTHGAYLPFCFNLNPVLEDKSLHVSSVFLTLLGPLGIQPTEANPLLDLCADDLKKADQFLQRYEVSLNDTLIGFNIGAGARSRMWPLEKFANLAPKLNLRFGARIILLSGPQDEDSSQKASKLMFEHRPVVAHNLALRELAAIVSRCQVLVSNDTGPMHLGPAVGVPTLGLFSVGYPEHYKPLGSYSRFLKANPIERLEVKEVYEHLIEMIEVVKREKAVAQQTQLSPFVVD